MLNSQRFTTNLNKVINVASKAVATYGSSILNTTHLVLGLLNTECEANNTLKKFGLTENNFSLAMGQPDSNVITYAAETESVFKCACDFAGYAGSDSINTEHLLLAILCGDTLAKTEFVNLGIDVNGMITSLATKLNLKDKLSSLGCVDATTEDIGPLEQFGYSLTGRAREGKLDPVIGRDEETERLVQILCRRTKNNPVLTGEAGVGKSAVVEGLSQLIVQNKVPDALKNKIIFSMDIAGLLAGTKFRGEFEQKLRDAVNFIVENKNIILFIDEIHNLVGAGSTGDSKMDAAEILKPMLARGELQTIGATTVDEYRRYIAKDPALERRFQVVNVEQPTVAQTVEILRGLRDKYEQHHGVTIDDDALLAAAQLSDRYITDRFLPDKAVDLIDEAASRVRLTDKVMPSAVLQTEAEISRLTAEKNRAKAIDDFLEAERLKNLIAEENIKLGRLKAEFNVRQKPVVTGEAVAETVSRWTGIPVSRISQTESEKLLALETILSESVIGQSEAVHAVSTAIRRARAGLKDPKRPIGSFIFVGSTGVGKTELCKALARTMFGEETDIITVDMSEYGEANSISKLIGAPPGFVGYEESGQLTEKVRRRPYSIVLFDEIEKAHPDVFNVFLQILDEGRLTDNRGRVVDFKNTIIIMTSNVGASIAFENGATEDYDRIKEKFLTALKQTFKPEFLNRVDDIIVFHPLDMQATKRIARLFTDKLCKRLGVNGLKVEVTPACIDLLATQGYSAEYGARPLKRVIQRNLEDKLSEALLAGKIKKGDKIMIDAFNGKILFKK